MFPVFDPSQLRILPLIQRKHDLDLSAILPLRPVSDVNPCLHAVASHILRARERGSAVVLMLGAHVLRSGVQRYIIDLMQRGYLTCIAMNGACVVHDFEFALIGQTTESVAHYIRDGQFGLWRETGQINDVVNEAAKEGLGLGEAVGRAIEEGRFPHRDISIFAGAYRLGVLATVHVGIGYDIVFEHPNCSGSAWGEASYVDFLRYARVLERLEGGVVMSFGSAVMAPEVYLKALAMVRNVAMQGGKGIANFVTLVCDLQTLPEDYQKEPEKESAGYFFRPWKTMLVRTVTDGGRGYYVRAPHHQTIPGLWTAIGQLEQNTAVESHTA